MLVHWSLFRLDWSACYRDAETYLKSPVLEKAMLAQQPQNMEPHKLKDATILIVDDQPINVEIIASHLSPYYKIYRAYSGYEAISLCEKHMPDLVIMDFQMPEIDGLAACQKIKSTSELAHIPILFATSLEDATEETKCWKAGCSDFFKKPVTQETLLNRVNSHLNIKFQNDNLRELVFIVRLTGLYNRRYYEDFFPHQIALANRKHQPLALLMIDIDHFKQYNDEYGHAAGDECLKVVACVIKKTLHRPTDVVARYGGEEFICLLPDTDKEGAIHVVKGISKAISQIHVSQSKSISSRVTVSIGVAYSAEEEVNIAKLTKQADEHLYLAKQAGRNCWM